MNKMKVKKILVYILLILHIVFLFCGIIMVVQSEDRAVRLVTDTIGAEDILVNKEQIEQSIELYSKEYKKRGTYISILSAMGIIVSSSGICTKNKKLKSESMKEHDEL